MTDYCIICETEPIEAKPQGMNFSWFREVEGCECVCPWCVEDMIKLRTTKQKIGDKE